MDKVKTFLRLPLRINFWGKTSGRIQKPMAKRYYDDNIVTWKVKARQDDVPFGTNFDIFNTALRYLFKMPIETPWIPY